MFIALNFVQNTQIRNKPKIKGESKCIAIVVDLKRVGRANTIVMLGMQVKTDAFSNPKDMKGNVGYISCTQKPTQHKDYITKYIIFVLFLL